MPESFSPDRPEPEKLRTTNDAFLDDLENKFDKPYTPAELAAQHQTRLDAEQLSLDSRPPDAEDASVTLNMMEGRLEQKARDERWEALDPDTKVQFNQERALFQKIGKVILSKRGDDVLVSLSEQARGIHQELGMARELYLDGTAIAKAFSEAVHIAVGQLEEIEHRLSSHS